MARARNIKPAFFTNDELAEIEPLGRLLFIGLWTLADYKGDIEWRAKRIKAQVLPYDSCDVQELAINLDKSGFIRFYSDGDKTYCRIPNFTKHQNPHKNERDKGSLIPDYSEEARQVIDLQGLTINRDKSGLKRNGSASDPADSLLLIPDSLILNPESLNLKPEEQTLVPSGDETPPAKPKANADVLEVFEHWKQVMGKSNAAKLTKERKAKVTARFKDGYTVDQIKQAIDGCAATDHNMGRTPESNGKRFDDLELICRTGSHVERFAGNLYQQQSPMQGLSRITQQNIKNLEGDW